MKHRKVVQNWSAAERSHLKVFVDIGKSGRKGLLVGLWGD